MMYGLKRLQQCLKTLVPKTTKKSTIRHLAHTSDALHDNAHKSNNDYERDQILPRNSWLKLMHRNMRVEGYYFRKTSMANYDHVDSYPKDSTQLSETIRSMTENSWPLFEPSKHGGIICKDPRLEFDATTRT